MLSPSCGRLGAVRCSGTYVMIIVSHCIDYSAFTIRILSSMGALVQFEGIRLVASPDIWYAPVDFDGQVRVVVDDPSRYTHSRVSM